MRPPGSRAILRSRDRPTAARYSRSDGGHTRVGAAPVGILGRRIRGGGGGAVGGAARLGSARPARDAAGFLPTRADRAVRTARARAERASPVGPGPDRAGPGRALRERRSAAGLGA